MSFEIDKINGDILKRCFEGRSRDRKRENVCVCEKMIKAVL